MPEYNGKNPKELLSLISARTDASGFYATGYAPQITGLLGSGVANHHILYDHLVRELNKGMFEYGLTTWERPAHTKEGTKRSFVKDPFDASFRPTSLTGLYTYGGGGGPTDEFFSNVKFLGSFDGSDAATSASDDAGLRTLTFSNDAALSTSVKKFGTASLKIDPDDDQANAKVLSESTSDFAFGTDDFTIELWFYKTVNAYGFLFDMRGGGDTTNTDGLYVTMGGGGNTELDLGLNKSNIIRTDMDAISNDQWHHYAVTKDSNLYRVFIDGALQASASNSTNLNQNKPIMIGNYHGTSSGGGFSFNGYIDEFRVTKGIDRYTPHFTPATSAFGSADEDVSFLSSFDGLDGETTTSGLDESDNNLTIAYSSGDELSSDEKKFGTTSLFVADNVTISSSAGFNMGTGEFTIEGWWYFTSFSNSFSIWDQWTGSSTGAGNTQMWMSHATAGKVKWYYDGSSLLQSTTTMSTGQWYHIAFVRESGTLKMYFNGQLDTNVTPTTQSFTGQFGKTGTVFLGDQHAGGGGAPNYYVDELRVTKGLARYKESFTAPTSAFPES